jgi:hypothetical protein
MCADAVQQTNIQKKTPHFVRHLIQHGQRLTGNIVHLEEGLVWNEKKQTEMNIYQSNTTNRRRAAQRFPVRH